MPDDTSAREISKFITDKVGIFSKGQAAPTPASATAPKCEAVMAPAGSFPRLGGLPELWAFKCLGAAM